jgi:hypothetical protein
VQNLVSDIKGGIQIEDVLTRDVEENIRTKEGYSDWRM